MNGFENLELMFLATLVKERINSIDQYHREHPNLPRQDDFLIVYQGMYAKLQEALPAEMRQSLD